MVEADFSFCVRSEFLPLAFTHRLQVALYAESLKTQLAPAS